VFTLPENYYRLAVSMTELSTGNTSHYRSNLETRDYSAGLVISDVLFASKIEQATGQSPFNRGAIEVVPHPTRRYAESGGSVPVYFEVYNLGTGVDDRTQYTVEYRIVPHSSQKSGFWNTFDGDDPVVSSQFTASGYRRDETQYVTFNTENLDDGIYDFLVTVRDQTTQDVAFRRSTFRIVDVD